MTLTRFPNGVSSFGLPVIGGRITSTGRAFFVNSNIGSNSYNGRDKDHPKDTIANALTVATSERGDVIYVMPGHAETLATTIACAVQKSGIKLIGLGHGANRPQITIQSAGDISVESDNFTMENFLLVGGATAATAGIRVAGKHCALRGIEWRETTPTLCGSNIIDVTSDGSGFSLNGFKFFATTGTTNATPIITLKASSTNTERMEINNVAIHVHEQRTAGAGIIHCDSSSPPTAIMMKDVIVVHSGASTEGMPFVWGTTTTTLATGMAENVYAGNWTDADQAALYGSSTLPDQMAVAFYNCLSANLPCEAGTIMGMTCATTA